MKEALHRLGGQIQRQQWLVCFQFRGKPCVRVCGWRGDGAGKDEEKKLGQNDHECVVGEMLFLCLGLGCKNTSSLCLSLRWEDIGDSFCVGVGATQNRKELYSFSRREAM